MTESRGSRRRPTMRPPMTPMIDCVFQLIIFFMLVPSLAAGDGYLTTNLPQWGPNGPAPPWAGIRIRLEDAGLQGRDVSIVLNDDQCFGSDFDGLVWALRHFRERGLAPQYPVLISPTLATRHKWVVRAFDSAVAAGFENVHFAVPLVWMQDGPGLVR